MEDNVQRNIRYLIKARRIKRKDLASALGVSEAAISYWENGTNRPSPSHMKAMCKIFGVTEDDIRKKDLATEEDVNADTTADRIRYTRLRLGMSPKEVMEQASVSPSMYYRAERCGQCGNSLPAIAEALGVSLEWLKNG